jgi:hypothetical protein
VSSPQHHERKNGGDAKFTEDCLLDSGVLVVGERAVGDGKKSVCEGWRGFGGCTVGVAKEEFLGDSLSSSGFTATSKISKVSKSSKDEEGEGSIIVVDTE